jgi:hypothetical protein
MKQLHSLILLINLDNGVLIGLDNLEKMYG